MVILKILPFRDKLDLVTMIAYDTKKVIQEHARLINVSLAIILMPDCVRTILRDTTESQIGDIPGMMEYRKVLESLTECNIKLQVMDKKAGKIPMSQGTRRF